MPRILRGLVVVGVAILFMASCVPLLPVAFRLADPMTHCPLGKPPAEFPVLVLAGDTPRVDFIDDPKNPPAAEPGTTYLVPRDKVKEIERDLTRAETRLSDDGGWMLRVDQLAPNRQRIELVWLDDGFSGGVYEAEAVTIKPLYQKLTGPAYAFFFGNLALLLNAIAWTPIWLARRWYVRRKAQGAAPTAT